MLAGLCNICDEQGHANLANLVALAEDVGQKANVNLKHIAVAVKEYQCYLSTKCAKQADMHSSYLELCVTCIETE